MDATAVTSGGSVQAVDEDIEMQNQPEESDGDRPGSTAESALVPKIKTEDEEDGVAVKKENQGEVRLEDLFTEFDSDEEFPSSAGEKIKTTSSPPQPSSPVYVNHKILDHYTNSSRTGPVSRGSDPEIMKSFYQRLFPWRYLFQWLNHSPTPSNDFGHREFAFTLQNDAYLRYQSFPTSDL
jgi:DNA primase small subunit